MQDITSIIEVICSTSIIVFIIRSNKSYYSLNYTNITSHYLPLSFYHNIVFDIFQYAINISKTKIIKLIT